MVDAEKYKQAKDLAGLWGRHKALENRFEFLKTIQAQAKGTLVILTMKFEKEEFLKMQKVLSNTFTKELEKKAPDNKDMEFLKEGEKF